MTTKTKIIIIVSVFLVGGAIGRFSLPSKVVEKEKIVYQDRVVVQKVEVASTVKKNNKVYTKTETLNKDGTKVVTTTVTDKTVTDHDSKVQSDKEQQVDTTTDKSKETTYAKESVIIGGAVKSTVSNFSLPVYGAFVDSRLIGPVHVQVSGFTDGSFILGAGIGF